MNVTQHALQCNVHSIGALFANGSHGRGPEVARQGIPPSPSESRLVEIRARPTARESRQREIRWGADPARTQRGPTTRRTLVATRIRLAAAPRWPTAGANLDGARFAVALSSLGANLARSQAPADPARTQRGPGGSRSGNRAKNGEWGVEMRWE